MLVDAGAHATVLITVTVDVADVALAPVEPKITLVTVSVLVTVIAVGLLDGAMHVWAALYRATRTKTLCMEGSH